MNQIPSNVIARNQPGQHTGLIDESGRGQTSPIYCTCPWTPMSKCLKCNRPVQSGRNRTFGQCCQHKSLPKISHMLAKCWVPPNYLVGQMRISTQFQGTSFHLIQRIHRINVHCEHLPHHGNQHQSTNEATFYLSVSVNSFVDDERFSLSLHEVGNEVIPTSSDPFSICRQIMQTIQFTSSANLKSPWISMLNQQNQSVVINHCCSLSMYIHDRCVSTT